MTQLLGERVKTLRSKLDKLSNFGKTKAESEALQVRVRDIQKIQSELHAYTSKAILLQDNNLLKLDSRLAQQVRRRLLAIKERFKKNSSNAELSGGSDWSALVKELPKVVQETKELCAGVWAAHVKAQIATEKPDALEASLAMTNENALCLQEYKKWFEEIRSSERRLPDSQGDISNLDAMALALRQAYTKFDFSVPDDVNRFLKAIGSGGASLELLTADVRNWLQANGGLKSYRIVVK